MSTIGQIATNALELAMQRASDVRGLAGRLAAKTPSIFGDIDMWGTRFAAPRLISLTASQATRAAEDLRGLLAWVDDGDCYARGVIGAARINELLGGRVTGLDDATRAAVAVVDTNMGQTGWAYHATPAYVSKEDGLTYVIDHLLGSRVGRTSGIFEQGEWAGHLHKSAADVGIQQLYDNAPIDMGQVTQMVGPGRMHGFGDSLADEIVDQARLAADAAG